MIPDCVIDLRVPDATQVYATLLRLAKAQTWCTASYKQIADLAGISDRHARRMVMMLAEHQMIRLEQRASDGMSLPNRYHLIAHIICETPNDKGMKLSHPPMTDVQGGYERQSPPYDSSSHVNGYVNEIQRDTLPPTPQRTLNQTEACDYEVVEWWSKTTGIKPIDKQAALQAAHTLLAAGFTLATLPGLYAHCKAEAKNGVTLPLMVKWADGYRAKAAPSKNGSSTADRLAYLKRGKRTHSWDLPSEHQRYESSWGAELLDQDIAALEGGR